MIEEGLVIEHQSRPLEVRAHLHSEITGINWKNKFKPEGKVE